VGSGYQRELRHRLDVEPPPPPPARDPDPACRKIVDDATLHRVVAGKDHVDLRDAVAPLVEQRVDRLLPQAHLIVAGHHPGRVELEPIFSTRAPYASRRLRASASPSDRSVHAPETVLLRQMPRSNVSPEACRRSPSTLLRARFATATSGVSPEAAHITPPTSGVVRQQEEPCKPASAKTPSRPRGRTVRQRRTTAPPACRAPRREADPAQDRQLIGASALEPHADIHHARHPTSALTSKRLRRTPPGPRDRPPSRRASPPRPVAGPPPGTRARCPPASNDGRASATSDASTPTPARADRTPPPPLRLLLPAASAPRATPAEHGPRAERDSMPSCSYPARARKAVQREELLHPTAENRAKRRP
jgi:hypothetical protein